MNNFCGRHILQRVLKSAEKNREDFLGKETHFHDSNPVCWIDCALVMGFAYSPMFIPFGSDLGHVTSFVYGIVANLCK